MEDEFGTKIIKESDAPPPKPKRSKRGIILIIVALVAIAVGTWYYLSTKDLESTDDATIDGHIVSLSAKVPGYITAVDVTDNQAVTKGETVLNVSPTDYQIALDHANAALASSEAKLAAAGQNYSATQISQQSNIDTAHADLASSEANLARAVADDKRLTNLNPEAFSASERDVTTAAEKAARADVAAKQSKLRSAKTAPQNIQSVTSFVESLAADVDTAKSAVAQAQQNLDDTAITVPFDGRVTKRTIEPGAYVQTGQQLLTVVSNGYWVTANYKENQIDRMRVGQPVTIKIDAYPGHIFNGKIDSLQEGTGSRFSLFPPENATGNFVKIVQRVPVKIVFTDAPDKNFVIGPGMSVVPTVHLK